jgi:TetR/AcrR family transcriptional regulator
VDKFAEFKRRTILDAATAIFSTKGVKKATMRAIAEEAEVTTGSLYSMFGGKEAIYAELLAESLARLHIYVKEKTAKAKTPSQAVRTAVKAFYDYYEPRLFEAQLGVYSINGIQSDDLDKEQAQKLNKALIATLEIFADTIRSAAPDLSNKQVRAERDAIFAVLLGVLSLAFTKRASSINTTPDAVLKTHLDALVERLTAG